MVDHTAFSLLARVLTSRPLRGAALRLIRDGVRRFEGRIPREVLGNIDVFFLRDMIGNIDHDGDGVADSFRFAVTNGWYDQRITGSLLYIDGTRVPEDRVIFRYPAGETRSSEVVALEFAPGDAMEIIAEGLTLSDGLHVIDVTIEMELTGQVIPFLPLLMKDGVGDVAVVKDLFAPLPDFPPDEIKEGSAHLVPHIHYDVEWMHTREKFEQVGESNLREMLRLMEEDPDMTFVLDQVPHLEPFRRRDPEGFERIKELVRQGRIEPVNGMYAEPDVNLPGGESLVRQSVAWQRYSLETFGVLSRCGWLIDSFGMSAQLPQILALSGVEFFCYSRPRVPKGTPSEFIWEGLDGTRIVAHCMPHMYMAGHPMPTDRARAMRKMLRVYGSLRERSASNNVLYPCGVDHGRPQGAYGEMVREWNRQVSGVGFSFSLPSRFFDELPKEGMPVLKGEFQRELWGTYSARIGLKQMNRQCEFALLDAEKISTVAALAGAPYPQTELSEASRNIMDNQFHDQICGCSVDEVAAGMVTRYRDTLSATDGLMRSAARHIAESAGTRGEGITVLAFNPLSRPVSSWSEFDVTLPPGWEGLSLSSGGGSEPLQILDSTTYGDGSLKAVKVGFRPELPACGYRLFSLSPGGRADAAGPRPVRVRGMTIENEVLAVEIDGPKGLLRRAVLSDGTGFDLSGSNRLTLERDFGHLYTSMALGATYLHRRKVTSVRPVEEGPLRGTIEVRGRIGRSPFTQRISLAAGSPRIDLETDLYLRDRNCRLRCVFPTGIEGGTWTHEVPYGCLERPGHELPAQNFSDLSDGRRGVTLINFGIPGNRRRGGTIYLTLLRSTDKIFLWDSGPDALELGRHEFRYALYPHLGDWREGGSLLEAYRRNNPPRVFVIPGITVDGPERAARGAVECLNRNVFVSALMCGGEGEVVIRLWETEGRPVRAELALAWEPPRAWKGDLLGRRLEEVAAAGGRLVLPLGPFEICTVITAR